MPPKLTAKKKKTDEVEEDFDDAASKLANLPSPDGAAMQTGEGNMVHLSQTNQLFVMMQQQMSEARLAATAASAAAEARAERAEQRASEERRAFEQRAIEDKKEAAEERRRVEERAAEQRHDMERRHQEAQALLREHMERKHEADDAAREKRERTAKLAVTLPKYTEPCDLGCYLRRFEEALKSERIPIEEWHNHLRTVLRGKAADALVTTVPERDRESYDNIKDILLNTLGLTRQQYLDQWFTPFKALAVTPDELANKGDAIQSALNKGITTLKEQHWHDLMMWMLRHYTEECGTAVLKEAPKERATLIIAIREYERKFGNSTRLRYKPQGRYGEVPERRPYTRYDERTPRPYGERPYYGEKRYGDKRYGDKPPRSPPPYDRQRGKQDFRCFHCGEPNHRASDCPNRNIQTKPIKKEVNHISTGSAGSLKNTIRGFYAGKPIVILADTGADISVIKASLVPPTEYSDEMCRVIGWGSKDPFTLHTADVVIQMGETTYSRRAAVAPDELLKPDIIMSIQMREMPLLDVMALDFVDKTPQASIFATRAQVIEDQEGQEAIALQEQADQFLPKDPQQFPDDKPEDTHTEPKLDYPLALPKEIDQAEFQREVMSDDSLAGWRQKAEDQNTGFHWDKKWLMLSTTDSLDRPKELLVIPTMHRHQLFHLTHDLHGHLGVKKIKEMLQQRVTWPGLHSDITRWCAQCAVCQYQRKNKPPKAPMLEIPVMTMPFEKVAIDLVGPFPRTKTGYRFLLTVIDLASRYPEAIPLKTATAEEVAEGLLDTFSRHGLPRMILSDQGTQLTGKIMQQMCDRLQIEKIRTTPYHPEANGCVERLHGTLVPMLRKTIQQNLDWAQQTKLCLFAIRSAPNRSTGFSPFELLYGHTLRSPADLLIDQWQSDDPSPINITQWMENLNTRLEALQEASLTNGTAAQAQSKLYHDQHAQQRTIKEGSLVLLRSPGMASKLESAWTGPYEVLRQVNRVNIEIGLPGKPTKKRKVVHINLTKPFNLPECKVLRIMAVADESEPDKDKVTLCGDQTDESQEVILHDMISKRPAIFSNEPGETTLCEHHIDTDSIKPIRSAPYSISPVKLKGVIAELRELISKGILVPSTSPWASPLVPVMKPDGSVRVCVDYRKLNSVTIPDPYFMPMIDEIITRVGAAVYLSKMDLSKGFYQVKIFPADQDKTAIITPIGKFKFTRMPFGLRNAPTTFQRLMDMVLAGQEEFAAPYIDDIIVFSTTWGDHLLHLTAVFDRLQQAGLTVKLAKCAWAKQTLEHLGQVVGNSQVSVPELKVKSLKEYRQPETKSKLKSFLGLAGYYRKFIPHFASYSKPLNDAAKLQMPNRIEWTKERLDSFQHLRETLGTMCTLHIPRESDDILLQTDASYAGLGGCLSAVRDKKEIAVAFFSRQLSAAEANYTVTELECLAVVAAIRHFETYLDGRHFLIQTDHKALEYLQTAHLNNRRLTRWALQLQGFHYTIQYRPGKENANADGMSRQSWTTSSSSPGTAPNQPGGDVGPTLLKDGGPA